MRCGWVLVLSGCATSLSPAASQIRWASAPRDVAGCAFRGHVSGSSMQSGAANISVGERNARNEALEAAARQGATHLLWLDYSSSAFGGVYVEGDAYACDGSPAVAQAPIPDDPAAPEPDADELCVASRRPGCTELARRYAEDQQFRDAGRILYTQCRYEDAQACALYADLVASNKVESHYSAEQLRAKACRNGDQASCVSTPAATGSSVSDTKPETKTDEAPAPKVTWLSQGTCFAVSDDGLVVTNAHVVAGANLIGVQFEGEEYLPATIEKASSAVDLVTLRVKRKTKAFLHVPSDTPLDLGDRVFTIGYPVQEALGTEAKYAEGTVFATTVSGEDQLVQVQIPLYPGNSGSALVTEDGQLAGVVEAIVNDDRFKAATGASARDIGYAIKVSYLVPLVGASTARKTGRKQAIARVQDATCKVLTGSTE